MCRCLGIHHSVYYYHCNHQINSYKIANQKLDVEIKKIDTELASKIDVSPKTCARMRVAPSYIHALNKKGIDILFNFSAFSKSKLTHGSKIYYFDKDEVDGAFAYISDVWW